jgi:hypothetical protein
MAKTAGYTPAPPADFILPFDLPSARLRGRFVRLDATSARALEAHLLPEPAARVAAETIVLATLLGSALKLDGRLTVQTKSDGPLDLSTADYYGHEGERAAGVRGYARLNEAKFAALGEAVPKFDKLAGSGVVGITIEPKREGQTYQGIVSLSPDGIASSAEAYFAQSEQLPTAIRLAAAPLYRGGARPRTGMRAASCCSRHPTVRSMKTIGSGFPRSSQPSKTSSWSMSVCPQNHCSGGCSTRTKFAYNPSRRSHSVAIAIAAASLPCFVPIPRTSARVSPIRTASSVHAANSVVGSMRSRLPILSRQARFSWSTKSDRRKSHAIEF